MAGTHGRPALDVKKDLVQRGSSFSFFQVMRLMNAFFSKNGVDTGNEGLPASFLRLRPNLSLSFPAAGIADVTETKPDCFTVTANLLGLYGSGSPLPTFYNEELIDDEGNGHETVRDLIDVANHRLYELLFAAWTKYRSMVKIVEEQDRAALERLYCLTGMDRVSLERELPSSERLLRYTGLFSMKTRSAKGLEILLRDVFGGLPVRIIQRVVQKGCIPEDQQAILGKTICLGQSSNLGQEYQTANGSFRIELGPLARKDYERFVPGRPDFSLMTTLTRLYVNQPLAFDVDIRLNSDEQPGTLRLGERQGTRLGLDSWVFSGKNAQAFRTRFYPDKMKAA